MTPARDLGRLVVPDGAEVVDDPVIGVGPEGWTWAWWASVRTPGCGVLSAHRPGGHVDDAWPHSGVDGVEHVQPLPGQRILLAGTTSDEGSCWAQVRTLDGQVLATGDLGRDVRHILTTRSGEIWVGYGDTATTSSGPGATGLCRFAEDLTPTWTYAPPTPTAGILACYALNVTDTAVHHCTYGDFHLIAIHGHDITDHGLLDRRGARQLLIEGSRGALIGGWGAAYDLITTFTVDEHGTHLDGQQQRLVLPDGLEIYGAQTTCRGRQLHLHLRQHWYAIDLDDLRP